MPILEVKNLYKSFAGLMATNNISFSMQEGEILGLIGPNGSGKTTLFNLISGFLAPDSGQVAFEEKDITGQKPHRICKAGMTRTFQIVKPFPQLTTLQNVMVGSSYGRECSKNIKQSAEEAEEVLEFTGLSSKKMILGEQLGLADRKRLEIARALATKPKLLLLDEVMAGLTPNETEEAMHLIKAIREKGVTIMVVEHVMRAVLGLSDRIMVISAGEKIAEGVPAEIINNQQVIEAYLGSRYATD